MLEVLHTYTVVNTFCDPLFPPQPHSTHYHSPAPDQQGLRAKLEIQESSLQATHMIQDACNLKNKNLCSWKALI
jgi:hypothetical protein